MALNCCWRLFEFRFRDSLCWLECYASVAVRQSLVVAVHCAAACESATATAAAAAAAFCTLQLLKLIQDGYLPLDSSVLVQAQAQVQQS